MLNGELKRAEPTQKDVIAAKFIGIGHPYSDGMLKANGTNAREILMCRERQLEIAVSLLSEKNRKKVGA
jgi:hypothetical protein